MALSRPAAELRELRRFRREAEAHFLSPYLASPSFALPSRKEELAVAAFVVLLHGALENFAEGVCLWLTNQVEQSWIFKQRISKATATLLLSTIPASTGAPQTSLFDRVRLALAQAKAERSGIVAKNNGIAPEHLRELLEPVGLTLTTDVVKIASLELLVSLRHQWAHQYRFSAKKTKSAADIVTVANDCVMIAEELARAASTLRT